MFFRKLVHTCPDCEVIGVLSAAVEHNNQRKLPAIHMAWNVDLRNFASGAEHANNSERYLALRGRRNAA
jgi:hypothetical protein